MEKVSAIFDEIFSKIWNIAALIFLGLIGKFSMDVMTGKKITVLQALASTGVALFVGVLTYFICEYFKLQDQTAFIVPTATLLSDKIVIAMMAFKTKDFIADWLQYWLSKIKGK